MQRTDYDAWGEITQETLAPGHVPVPFGYGGGLLDRDTGLVRFGARDYDPRTGRWTAKDPIRFDGGDTNLFAYVGNDPVDLVDPLGLSDLVFDRAEGTLTVRDSSGNEVRQFPAANGTSSKSKGPWPDGTFPYSHHVPHAESGATGPYGSNGNFVFDVPGRSGMGVHSGRRGPSSKTLGCIRTTDDATAFLKSLNVTDPIGTITVK